jgi:RNA-binding protein with serine-rich domain 1
MTNRGTAYILYTTTTEAEAAIAHMHESQLDGSVINVSIVLPRRKFSPSPPLARTAVSRDAPLSSNSYRGPPREIPRRRSPVTSYRGDIDRGERAFDTYRPRSRTRSRSPRRRSRSVSSRGRERSPIRRRGGRDSPGRNGTRGGRRRSLSYSSYSSYDDRSRSRSRGRGGRGRR